MARTAALTALLFLLNLVPVAAQPDTLRVDYYHSGNAMTKVYSLYQEPLPWPGQPKKGSPISQPLTRARV